MRILIFNPDGGAALYIVQGYINAFKELGHEIKIWDGKPSSWNFFSPDIYVGCSGWQQPIPKKRKCKVILHVNPYGKNKITPEKKWINIDENPENINWVMEQNPDLLFGYGNDRLIGRHWNYWLEKKGIPVIGLPTAADSGIYKKKNLKSQYDISFVGGRWGYKSISFEKWLDPILKKHKNHIIYGWGGWERTGFNYSGEIKTKDTVDLFNSTKICPAISEPHTHIYGIDIPERIFKTALCGCLTITDKIEDLNEFSPMAETPEKMLELVEYYLKKEKERKELSEIQRKYVLKNHTYIKRTQKLMEYI
jgi:spore maturation protein CgeB